MYLLYVDESGDCGMVGSPSRYFVLSALVVHELRWRTCLDELIAMRKNFKSKFGLNLREEFHSAKMITHPGHLKNIKRHNRLAMVREFAEKLSGLTDMSSINVVVDKSSTSKPPQYDVFESAWTALIQRFENTMAHRNFNGPANPDERGMIFSDHTDDKKLRNLIRKLHVYNPIPNQPRHGAGQRNLPLKYAIEDPNFRNSMDSYFIQAADLAAFLLYQKLAPNKYMRKNAGGRYFDKMKSIVCAKISSSGDGIVWL